MKTAKIFILFFFIHICLCSPAPVYGEAAQEDVKKSYQEYKDRFDGILTKSDISEHGFSIIKDQVFPVTVQGAGEVSVVPAYDDEYNRLALFFCKKNGKVIFKTDQLETNNQRPGKLAQPNERLAAISFQDMNNDTLTDIVLITTCINEAGDYKGRSYKVGDVLFQKKGRFYRDYRLSDKINRFGMNKSVKFITTFIRDGYSTEFLYTANTKKDLLDHGFQVIADQSGYVQFEKLGKLFVLSGTYHMAEYSVFMIYLVNEEGYIVWSFQPMGDFEELYSLKGVLCTDIDGDGMKDLAVLARYSYDGSQGESVVEMDYSVYYQRTARFYEDTDIKNAVPCQDDFTMSQLVKELRKFWGWRSEQ